MNQAQKILITHNQVWLPDPGPVPTGKVVLATLMGNIAYFGYALSQDAFTVLRQVGDAAAKDWWAQTEPVLKALTGDDKDLDAFVVYKNFPQEVLAMDEADYWFRQICMYWGFPNEIFTTAPEPRPELDDTLTRCVLQLAPDDALSEIFANLLALPAHWIERQLADAIYLATTLVGEPNLSAIAFKENLISLGLACLEQGQTVTVETATDVLRLAVGMSEGDISLREPGKLRSFKRKERRFLLQMLESAPHLAEDFARRPEQMKRLLHALRPGDYARRYPQVCRAYDQLYRGQLPPSFNSQVEAQFADVDEAVLVLLKARPGEFMRRLHACVVLFEDGAIAAFLEIIPKLSTGQLLKLHRYLETVNQRKYRTFAPRGNWTKLQIANAAADRQLSEPHLKQLLAAIAQVLSTRLKQKVGPVRLDSATAKVKLQTSDSDLLPYGRGTVFPIPRNIKFLRTASYWESGPTRGNIWYDNGWNFFGEDWQPRGACCWTDVHFGTGGAIFSGDPTNSKDLKGRACQMIDLYPDILLQQGVRYAVWNILCFNRISFNGANEVYAALMWGEEPETGNLFEPSRCQLSFPLTGDNLTKYVAYIDLQRRELIYIDANLRGSVRSAAQNTSKLAELMPAFVEYLNSLPSVLDLFVHAPQASDGLPILYSDKDERIEGDVAWVFRPENHENSFEALQLNQLLG
ncbi:MAG: hypothetical protein F6J87_21730 [Spirulina sp. SIO3F2]|nr:hypothetical protein [Spirulina sp. SIO3F2]